MSEIEVNEYVRTNRGIIGKIKRIEFDEVDKSLKWYVFDRKKPDINIVEEIYINKPYIVKHSKDIRELIDLDDYVAIEDEVLPFEYVWQIIEKDGKWKINNFEDVKTEDIKAVVTKERFLSEVYKF